MTRTTPRIPDEETLYAPAALPVKLARSVKEPFCDWRLVEPGYGMPFWQGYQEHVGTMPWLSPRGVKLRVYPPRVETKIADEEPTGQVGGYCTLIRDGEKLKLWHESYGGTAPGDFSAKVCLLESDDGQAWERPEVGLIEFGGNLENNLVYGFGSAETGGATGGHGAGVFIDERAPSDERYKMAYIGPTPEGATEAGWIYGAVSPDGKRWRKLDEPLLKAVSDTQNICVRNEEGVYHLYLRGWDPRGPAGGGGRRMVMESFSERFGGFSEPRIILTAPLGWGPQIDLYTNSYSPWPGALGTHLMLSTVYERSADTTSVQLAVKRDGGRWEFVSPEPLVGGHGSPELQTCYAGGGLVELGGGRWGFGLHVSEKGHNEYKHKERGLYLATIREDGFAGIEAELAGEFTTFPLLVEGEALEVNGWARPGGSIRAELLRLGEHARPVPLPGFSLDDCEPLQGDSLWKKLRWTGGNIAEAGEGPLRIRFELTRARLHAIRAI